MPSAPLPFDHRVFEVDGVRVLHVPSADTTCSVDLIFAVGQRHETLPTAGALHALEHLAMSRVRGTALDVNAEVSVDRTRFEATGSPARIGPYLAELCAALPDPPVERLPAEARVLAAESHSEERESHPLLLARYGYRDLGLVGAPGPAPDTLPPEVIRGTARSWFVAGNALLVVDGPLPADLRLPLPPGRRPAVASVPGRRFDRPSALDVDGPLCAVSLTVPPAEESLLDVLLVDLVVERVEEALRHTGGFSYTVDADVLVRSDGRGDLLVTADPPPDRAVEAGRTLVDTVLSLLRDGPTEAEVAAARERLEERRSGRSAFLGELVCRHLADLEGLPVPAPDPARIAALTADDLRRALALAGRDVLFGVDEEVRRRFADTLGVAWHEPRRPGPPPPGAVFRPPLLAKLITRQARGLQVTLHADGISRSADGLTDTVRWADAAGLMRLGDDDAVLFGLDGNAIPLGDDWFRHGNRLIQAATANLPAGLVYQGVDPDAGDP